MINYQKLLNKNMIGVLKDILKNINDNGLSNSNHLYITFLTQHKNVEIPNWLRKKYNEEMTIVIQYEYNDLKIEKDFFQISLSFNDIKTDLKIGYDSIISFADPSANFGLILQSNKTKNNNKKINDESKKDNIINFSKYKKN